MVVAPVLADGRHRLGGRLATRHPLRRIAVRDRLEDQEGEDRDGDQHHDHREEAADDEAAHQCSIRTVARGSSASRTPSPKMLIESTAITSIRPGTIVRWIALGISWRPSKIIVPQDGFGGWTPAPR